MLEYGMKVAQDLVARGERGAVIVLVGDVGAGKTTFTTALCRHLGVDADAVSSPTFAIINSYSTAAQQPVYHFDFYRLKNIDEAYDIGYEEYFYSGDWVFTEWTEKVEELLPDHYVRVEIEEHDKIRILTAKLMMCEGEDA